MDFEFLGDITEVESIARGTSVQVRHYLNRTFGRGNWRKLKGVALIRDLKTEHIGWAEIHWFEAHGIGRRLVHDGLNRPIVQPGGSRTRLERMYYGLIYAAAY